MATNRHLHGQTSLICIRTRSAPHPQIDTHNCSVYANNFTVMCASSPHPQVYVSNRTASSIFFRFVSTTARIHIKVSMSAKNVHLNPHEIHNVCKTYKIEDSSIYELEDDEFSLTTGLQCETNEELVCLVVGNVQT